MLAAEVAQVGFEGLDGGVALLPVSRCDDEDEGFGLGACLQELVDHASADAKAEATADVSIDCRCVIVDCDYLLAPVTRT